MNFRTALPPRWGSRVFAVHPGLAPGDAFFRGFAATIPGWGLAALFCILTAASLLAANEAAHKDSGVAITHRDFHGWDAVVLRNQTAEVVVVPAIGRIMQFSLLDAKGGVDPGPFWNNPALGEQLKPDSEGWTNFGGDKAWPAPQGDWPKVTGGPWPPPKGFDAMPYTATVTDSKVQIVSPIDPAYGIRVRRTVSLDPRKPVMTVVTAYEKVEGAPVRIGVWTITQLVSPDRAFIHLPAHSAFPQGYVSLLPAAPKDLKSEGRLLSLSRDPVTKTMIGSDGSALLWVGNGPDLLIEHEDLKPAGGKAEWPEQGSHTKIYTNSGEEAAYVEFELLDWLRDLKPGENGLMTNTYTLIPRTETRPLDEAKKVFGQR